MQLKSMHQYDYLFKLLLIGSPCGKTNILERYVDNSYSNGITSTIGVDFKIKTEIVLSSRCKLQLWDTSGLERFRSITSSYYRGVHGILLCFDITDMDSFEDLKKDFLLRLEFRSASENCNIILVGNKLDSKCIREVSTEEAKEFATSFGWNYFEVSAKDGTNINELFSTMTEELLLTHQFALDGVFNKSEKDNLWILKVGHPNANKLQTLIQIIDKYKHKGSVKFKLLDELRQHQVRLVLDLKEHMVDIPNKIDSICQAISFVSKYVAEMYVVNRGTKKIFEEIKKHFSALKCCTIKEDKVKGIENSNFVTDYELYILAARHIEELSLEIDDKLLDVFSNDNNKIWNNFAFALMLNMKLKSFGISISQSTIMNNPQYIERMVNIFGCIQTSKTKLKSLDISVWCYESVEDNKPLEQTRKMYNILHSAINNCIASKAGNLERMKIEITCQDEKESKIRLFDEGFCRELLDINYTNLSLLCLNVATIQWNNISVNALSSLMNRANGMDKILINGKLFLDSFDVDTDLKCIQVLFEAVKGNKVTLPMLSNQCTKHCLASICKFIQSSNTEYLTLSFESLEFSHVYQLLDVWCDRLHQLCKDYKEIKNYLGLYDETIRNSIFEYCQLKEFKLFINTKNCVGSTPKVFLLIKHLYNRLGEIIIDLEKKQDEYEENMKTLTDLLNIVIAKNNDIGVMVYIDNKPLIMGDEDDFDESKWQFLANVNYQALCYGYVREACQFYNVYMPNPIYGVIWHFYPNKYNIFEVDVCDNMGPRIKAKVWGKASAICDSLNLYYVDNCIQFKTCTNNEWYAIDRDECKVSTQVISDPSNSWYKNAQIAFKRDDFFIDMISRKHGRFDIDYFTSMLSFVTNYGDVLLAGGPFTDEKLYPSSTFLSSGNKCCMVSVNGSANHMVFLTLQGNVFTIGANDVGQCGVYNKAKNNEESAADTDVISDPLLLKELSNKCIKSTHVGSDFNFCIDKDDNLYCFGHNNHNKLGLSDEKSEQEVVWQSIIHPYFNKNTTGKVAQKINGCGNIACFVDDKFQCYFSGRHAFNKNKLINMCHWQSLNEEMKNVKIKHAHCIDDENDEDHFMCLVDFDDKVRIILNGETLCAQIEGLGNSKQIQQIYIFPQRFLLITT